MSAFIARKLRSYFRKFDFNKDGLITERNFEDIAKRFVAHHKLDEKKGKELRMRFDALWEKHLEIHGDSVNEDGFVKVVLQHIKDQKLKDLVGKILDTAFHAIDVDGDGVIHVDDYKTFFEIMRFDVKDAADAFKMIDRKHAGHLTREEFTNAGVDYFFNDDESSPIKNFWGPLLC